MAPTYVTEDDLSEALSEHYTKSEIDAMLGAHVELPTLNPT
jgi:hypothetical protein